MDHQQMAELTAIYFVLRPHGSVCIYWGNDTFEEKKERLHSEGSVEYCLSPPPKEGNRKINDVWAAEKHLGWEAEMQHTVI